jgi:hypothetical protein
MERTLTTVSFLDGKNFALDRGQAGPSSAALNDIANKPLSFVLVGLPVQIERGSGGYGRSGAADEDNRGRGEAMPTWTVVHTDPPHEKEA